MEARIANAKAQEFFQQTAISTIRNDTGKNHCDIWEKRGLACQFLVSPLIYLIVAFLEWLFANRIIVRGVPMEIPKTLVMVPAYNEGENIGKVITDMVSLGLDSILVVCNSCQDDTAEQAQEAGATVIRIPEASIGEAFRLALRYAVENDFDYLVRTDADGQFRLEDLARVIEMLLRNEVDVAVGVRKNLEAAGPFHKAGCQFLALLLTLLTRGKLNLPDVNCGLIGLKKSAFLPLSHYEYGRWPEPEILLHAYLQNLRIKPVEVTVEDRHHGRSSISCRNGIGLVAKSMLKLPWRLAMSKLEHETTEKE